ncbi:hypothetical protein QOZ80_3AG0229960 [Eleusine coracana subsp. coracana]|nr:hypothetical protein QOZ80_3AG0229960 [Eleusine coracana subsp. coracana]
MAAHHVDDAHHRGGAGGGRSGGAVGEQYMKGLSGEDNYGQQQQEQSAAAAVAKALAAGTAALSLLLLSGLALTGTVLALIVATPLLVIFSPVLVPAAFTVALLMAGFVSSGGLGAAAVGVLAWMYRYLQHQHHGEAHHVIKEAGWAHH